MKKLILVLFLIILSTTIQAQTKADSLVKIGIMLHDKGEYEKAINIYKEALKLEPNNPQISYELSFSYTSMKDYDNAIIYADYVLKNNRADKDIKRAAIITKGSALDYQGKTMESIKLFEDCINDMGPNYLVYYNLGVDYYFLKEYKKAEESFVNAIYERHNHPGSHFMLGFLMSDLDRKCMCLFSTYYFLCLEPGTERSKKAYKLITSVQNSFYKKNENSEGTTIFVDKDITESSMMDFWYSISKVANLSTSDSSKSKEQLFMDYAKDFVDFSNTIKKDKIKGIWLDFYIPIFNKLSKSEYLKVFCNLISISNSRDSRDWIKENPEKEKEFKKWIKENN